MTHPRALALCFIWLALCLPAWSAPDPPDPVAPLSPGGKPAAFKLPDVDGVIRASEQFAGKVVVIVHSDPDHRDDNDPLCEAVKQAVKAGRLSGEVVLGLGIADCQSSWMPRTLMRLVARFKAHKFGATVLFDNDGAVRRDWCLQGAASTVAVLDKNGVCRFLAVGRLAPERIAAVVELLTVLQGEERLGDPKSPDLVRADQPQAPQTN